MKALLTILLLAMALLFCQAAFAHDLDLTSVKIIKGGALTKIDAALPLSRFVHSAGLPSSPSPAELDRAVRQRLGFDAGLSASIRIDSEADMLFWSGESLGSDLSLTKRLDESTPNASTLVDVYEGGKLQSHQVLTGRTSEPAVIGMIKAGAVHILAGLDHILFVVGLALLGGGWKSLAKTLTAFTLAHSLTLACGALGIAHGIPRIVEPMIALSIVALAVEGLMGQNRAERFTSEKLPWWRPALAFGFGLVHGFGFSGGLTDLGVSGSAFLQNLGCFSLGIEFGQALILAMTLMMVRALMMMGKERAQKIGVAASLALGMVGSFWFVERIL